MFEEKLLSRLCHFKRDQVEAPFFETLQNSSHDLPLNSVRFDHYESPLVVRLHVNYINR